jgi:hypothetical protein
MLRGAGTPGTATACTAASGWCRWRRKTCEKTAVLSHLYINAIFLPRQARDNHRDNSKTTTVFSGRLRDKHIVQATTATATATRWRREMHVGAGKTTSLLRCFVLNNDHLPRQARDKPRESTQTKPPFSRAGLRAERSVQCHQRRLPVPRRLDRRPLPDPRPRASEPYDRCETTLISFALFIVANTDDFIKTGSGQT